jgi:hypothetical protein
METINSGLSINQRNLYCHFLAHQKRNKHAPCFVPKLFLVGNRLETYLNALAALERKGLIRVDRSSPNYTGWIMLPAKTVYQHKQQSPVFS